MDTRQTEMSRVRQAALPVRPNRDSLLAELDIFHADRQCRQPRIQRLSHQIGHLLSHKSRSPKGPQSNIFDFQFHLTIQNQNHQQSPHLGLQPRKAQLRVYPVAVRCQVQAQSLHSVQGRGICRLEEPLDLSIRVVF